MARILESSAKLSFTEVRSWLTLFRKFFLCIKYKNTINTRAANAPQAVPSVPPAALYAFSCPTFSPTLYRYMAAPILTTAFTICSKICETAVGTMVPSPWKNPRSTPRIHITNNVGASTLMASAAEGNFHAFASQSAPK